MTRYEPDPAVLRVGITCGWHCGHVPAAHHTDGRCYTPEEMAARLGFFQRTGQWPGPDEGCPQEEEET